MRVEPTREEIVAFLHEQTAFDGPITLETRLQNDMGIYGDDLWEFVEAFETRFDVNMDSFLWYFHSNEEGIGGLGQILFPPPNARVREIPITPHFLLLSARSGTWAVEYPDHELPNGRPDLLVNRVVLILLVMVVIVFGCIALSSGCR